MAELNGFSGRNLNQNLDLIEEKLDVARYEKPHGYLDTLIKGSVSFSHEILIFLSLGFLLVSVILFCKKYTKKWVLAGVLFSASFLGLNAWIQSWDKYIVTQVQTIYDGPSGLFKTMNEVPQGIMIVTIHYGDWLKIIYLIRQFQT